MLPAYLLEEAVGHALGSPGELRQPRQYLSVDVVKSLSEEPPLLRGERGEVGVVVPHHQHHVLAQASVTLAVGGDVHRDVGDLEPQLLPVVHLREELQQRAVEVLLEVAVTLAAGGAL